GHVEGDREAALALLEEELVAPVRLFGAAEPGELSHRPQASPVHRVIDAAGHRSVARVPEVALVVQALDVLRRVEGLQGLTGERLEVRVALPRLPVVVPPAFVIAIRHRFLPPRRSPPRPGP